MKLIFEICISPAQVAYYESGYRGKLYARILMGKCADRSGVASPKMLDLVMVDSGGGMESKGGNRMFKAV